MGARENPPAFPLVVEGDFNFANEGMTLRDWFAGQAVASAWDAAMQFSPSGVNPEDFAAMQAYAIADAMLAEREKRPADDADMQHVAYFDEGEFHWMSGIKPRACELYARARGAQS